MGPISGFEDRRSITSEKDLERALLELTPKLFFNFYVDENNVMIIEVPKQLINKVKRYIVPHMRFWANVRVLERGKKHKVLDRFRKEYL